MFGQPVHSGYAVNFVEKVCPLNNLRSLDSSIGHDRYVSRVEGSAQTVSS